MNVPRGSILRLANLMFSTALIAVTPCGAGELVPSASSQSTGGPPSLLRILAENGSSAADKQHPLMPIRTYAHQGYDYISRGIHDYSCVLIKREQVDGKITDYQHIQAKIRHQRNGGQTDVPFSVYLRFLSPARLAGREVLFVRGQNNDDLVARRGGQRLASITLNVSPTGPLAMEGNRYPITEIGIQNLVGRLVEVIEEELKFDECEVKYFTDARLNGRSCTHIQVTHPVRRPYFRYYLARMFIDNQLQVPIYFVSYDWPQVEGEEPMLFEEYAYTQMKLNVGFTDEDFQRTNPAYGFGNPSQEASR